MRKYLSYTKTEDIPFDEKVIYRGYRIKELGYYWLKALLSALILSATYAFLLPASLTPPFSKHSARVAPSSYSLKGRKLSILEYGCLKTS